tara:strand:+ start:7173 stop:7400 length:228 start_codon:yes stop_codon:yes gene_type:complete
MLLINDNELVEAIIGGIGFFIIMWFFRGYLKFNWLQRAGIIFPFVWIIRKMGMNIYKYVKTTHKIADTKFNIMDF